MNVKVETYSGYKADEYPVKFYTKQKQLEVIDIEDRWYGPGYSYFKVLADDCMTYILRQNLESDQWNIECVK